MKRLLTIILLLLSVSLFAQTKEDSIKVQYIDQKITELKKQYSKIVRKEEVLDKDYYSEKYKLREQKDRLNEQFAELTNDRNKLLAKKPAEKK